MRAVLLDGALADAAARGGHDDVQPAELVDGLLQHRLGAGEVGHVDLVEGGADRRGDVLAVRLRSGPGSRRSRHRLASDSAVALPKPDAPPTTMAFFPEISI